MNNCTKSISEYISEISKIISVKNEDAIVVYRGEGQAYTTHCQPNLFRGNYLKKNVHFEKNLFDEMTANKLTNGSTYLEKAIDAQHGGFPSRLLDVTYNSLVALYFAITPEPSKPENFQDGENGVVYVYFIEKLFCPSGDNINSIYDSIVMRDKSWFSNQNIFQKNHKLIDHIKTNKRIIAQQGAFILFQGDIVSPIPISDYKKIEIASDYKSKIRRELKELFGIHTGSIYPEPNNLVSDITNKSYVVNCNKFNLDTELDLVVNNLERELEFFYNNIINEIYSKHTEVNFIRKLAKKIIEIEEITYSYKIGIIEIKEEINDNVNYDDKEKKEIEEIIQRYNFLVNEFYESIKCYILGNDIEFSIKELLLGECGDEK